MIAKIIFIALVSVVLCSEAEITAEFGSFLKKYGKKYDSIEETIMRYNIFKKNYDYIQKYNSKNNGVQLGINHLADLTDEEFKAKYLGRKPTTANPCAVKHVPIEPKETIDWRDKGVVSRIKDQANCGSCWAFSSTGALESLHAIKTGNLIEYSEQELVDCTRGYGENEGCNGGEMCQSFQYVKEHGISTEKEYPYEAKDRACRKKSEALKISGCVYVEVNNSNALLEALAYGPVSISVKGSSAPFKFYSHGIIKEDCDEDDNEIDHAILLVGAGIDHNSHTPYWIVKNSWSTYWGNKGYALIKRDTANGPGVCGIAMENFYPVM